VTATLPAPPPKGQGYATRPAQRETGPLQWDQIATVARTDLKSLIQAKDFWGPMVGLGALFFCVVPTILLFSLTSIATVDAVEQISQTLEVLPDRARASIDAATGGGTDGGGSTAKGQASYALAVYLFAPVAVVVPLTISTAVGAATIVGERERGTGEFLAHSPAGVREIYLGKLLASLVPGYATTIVGFGIYSLIVNLIVGPEVGGWFFPTSQWWILMGWVVPPFLALTLSLVLRLSARVKSTAAAQQASGLVSLPLIMVAYSQSTGALFGGSRVTWIIGGLAWVLAVVGLRRGMRAVSRARLLGVADEQ
jgi:ABC-type Na+ efflux pump permease subunit